MAITRKLAYACLLHLQTCKFACSWETLHTCSVALCVIARPGLQCQHEDLDCSRMLTSFLLTSLAFIDAPGMSGDDIHVELHEGTLKVSGEKSRQFEEGKQGHKVWRQERSFQKFQRCFSLPEDANPEGISARLEHGVLTVEVSKKVKRVLYSKFLEAAYMMLIKQLQAFPLITLDCFTQSTFTSLLAILYNNISRPCLSKEKG